LETYQWCPTVAEGGTQLFLRGVDNLAVKLVGIIDFPSLTNQIFYSTKSRDNIFYPDENANTYRIKDFFEISKTNYSQVLETGGVLELIMEWNCNVDDSNCRPDFQVRFINQSSSVNPLNQPLGFFVESSNNYEDKRDYTLDVAIKFNMISRGSVKAFNLYNLLIQVKFNIFVVLSVSLYIVCNVFNDCWIYESFGGFYNDQLLF